MAEGKEWRQKVSQAKRPEGSRSLSGSKARLICKSAVCRKVGKQTGLWSG